MIPKSRLLWRPRRYDCLKPMRTKNAQLEALKKSADHAVKLHAGQNVIFTDDFGQKHQTVTESDPWMLSHGQWVIKLRGKSGGYDCARVVPE